MALNFQHRYQYRHILVHYRLNL